VIDVELNCIRCVATIHVPDKPAALCTLHMCGIDVYVSVFPCLSLAIGVSKVVSSVM